MDLMLTRLQGLKPVVEEICRVSGTAGCSIGILHHGQVIHTANFGFRDVEAELAPNEETIYYLASLSKSFTAAAVALLVNEKKLEWSTPVSSILKDLQHRDRRINEHANMIDWMSHRTGLAPKNHLWSQEYGHLTFKRGETMRTVTYLERIAPFRARWIYNNWGYGVADELVEFLGGMSWGSFLSKKILAPLQMTRTVTEHFADLTNVAKAYMSLANGNPYHLPVPEGEDGDSLEGALAVRSCVKDLLIYYQAFLDEFKNHADNGSKAVPRTPFVDVLTMTQAHIPLSSESPELDGSYGLGWVQARLPCTLGAIGLNHAYVDRMPIVGKGIPEPQVCLYHQGSANTFLTSVHLLPETQSGVVVLTNSMSKNDAADWLGELYLEALIDAPQKNDYVKIARSSADAAMALWPAMIKELAKNRIPGTHCRSLHDFAGTYYNVIANYRIEIFLQRGKLSIRFQNGQDAFYELEHYHYDTFSWVLTHDQDVEVGRFPITRASFYLLKFLPANDNTSEIDRLVWAHDDEVLDGETFYKRPERGTSSGEV